MHLATNVARPWQVAATGAIFNPLTVRAYSGAQSDCIFSSILKSLTIDVA